MEELIIKERMTSLEIAEVTGKQHAHVLRDIKAIIEQGVSASNFGLAEYKDQQGKMRPMYSLTKKGCLLLASGYDALLREKIINRWEELETAFRKATMPSYQIADPIARAERWIEEQKEKQALAFENKQMKPKAEYFDELVERKMLSNFRDTAKELGIRPKEFVNRLEDDGFIYHTKKGIRPYAEHVGEGLFALKDAKGENKWAGIQTLITPKGKETFRLLYAGIREKARALMDKLK